MKLTKRNLDANQTDIADFARSSGNEFYASALAAYDTAMAVLDLAVQERDAALQKLAMQVKLCDADAYAKFGIDWDAMDDMSGGEKLIHLMSKGRYRYGQTSLVEKDFTYNR